MTVIENDHILLRRSADTEGDMIVISRTADSHGNILVTLLMGLKYGKDKMFAFSSRKVS